MFRYFSHNAKPIVHNLDISSSRAYAAIGISLVYFYVLNGIFVYACASAIFISALIKCLIWSKQINWMCTHIHKTLGNCDIELSLFEILLTHTLSVSFCLSFSPLNSQCILPRHIYVNNIHWVNISLHDYFHLFFAAMFQCNCMSMLLSLLSMVWHFKTPRNFPYISLCGANSPRQHRHLVKT